MIVSVKFDQLQREEDREARSQARTAEAVSADQWREKLEDKMMIAGAPAH